ncbi:hypothetical protein ACVWZV_009019 [Bradyrhizobium sp. GM5.1]
MRRMGIEALYRRPRTTRPEPGHKIHPYLLRGMEITRPNQVWAMDITYIPMASGFVYLAAVLDWATRRVLSWRLSITMEAAFCVETLEDALARHGKPDIFNTDQGAQFTGQAFTGVLADNGIAISMDGKGAWRDNVFSNGSGAASNTRRWGSKFAEARYGWGGELPGSKCWSAIRMASPPWRTLSATWRSWRPVDGTGPNARSDWRPGVPDLDIFSQGLIERTNGGWRTTRQALAIDHATFVQPAAAGGRVAPQFTGDCRSSPPQATSNLLYGMALHLEKCDLLALNQREVPPGERLCRRSKHRWWHAARLSEQSASDRL